MSHYLKNKMVFRFRFPADTQTQTDLQPLIAAVNKTSLYNKVSQIELFICDKRRPLKVSDSADLCAS